MFQIGFKIYQYSNPGRLLTPGVQLSHQMALTLLFFDQFYYFFLQIIHELWLLQNRVKLLAVDITWRLLVVFRRF
jgi:hypothetical protein